VTALWSLLGVLHAEGLISEPPGPSCGSAARAELAVAGAALAVRLLAVEVPGLPR
jgi:hypothetical protein